MTIKYTTNFQIAYADTSTALNQLADVTQQVANSLDAAMGRAGYTPPNSTDFAALSAQVQAIQTTVNALAADTGWKNITIASGFAQYASNYVPQARQIGSVVFLRGAFAPTGMTATATFIVGTLPAGIALPGSGNVNFISASNTVATGGRLLVNTAGAVQIITPATLGTYYAINSSYLAG